MTPDPLLTALFDRLPEPGSRFEATYRRHITMRAAAMNTDERNLAYAIEWAALMQGLMDMHDEVA